MRKPLTHFVRVSPAMVVAILALFVAMGGTAVAAKSLITGAQIKNGSITGADIKNKSLTSRDIRGQLRGPRGAAGAQGLPGTAGAAGPQGPPGPTPDCAAGTRPALGACFEEVARGAQHWYGASETCGNANRRLPTASELRSFRLQAGISLADPEVTSNVFDNGIARYEGMNDLGILSFWTVTAPHQFRCVASRVG